MVLYAYFYKLLGHCLRVSPLSVKKSGNLLSYRYWNINQSHISLHIQGPSRTILISFRVPDITDSDQCTQAWEVAEASTKRQSLRPQTGSDCWFHFSKYTMLGSWERHSMELPFPNRSQAAGLIKRHNGLFKQLPFKWQCVKGSRHVSLTYPKPLSLLI